MRTLLAVLGGLVVFAFVLILGVATSWFGLIVDRPMQQYAEETRREVYDTSRSYNQGSIADFRRYCADWKKAEGQSKDADAELIRSTFRTFTGAPLPSDVQACIAEVN